MPRFFIGIDPGASGGMSCLDGKGIPKFRSIRDDLGEVWFWIAALTDRPIEDSVVCLEKVGGYVGGVGQPGSAMFNFGRSYGNLEAFVIAAGMIEGKNFHYVRPQEWQKHFGIVPRRKTKGKIKGETSSQWKNRLKSEAEKRFPSLKITLSTSDSLLIALYCKEIYS